MQAINTKWIPGTHTKPNRIKAFCPAGSITMGADSTPYASHDERAHRHVAQHLMDKLNWDYPIISGDTKDGFVFVIIPQQIVDKLNKDNFEVKRVLAEYYR